MEREWVLIVQNSATEHFQVFDDTREVRKPKWLVVLLKFLALGSKLYGIPDLLVP